VLGCNERRTTMFFAGVLIFSISVLVVSYAVSRTENADKGKIAFFTTLVAWGSMGVGLLLSKIS
jgi:hypothetical protein